MMSTKTYSLFFIGMLCCLNSFGGTAPAGTLSAQPTNIPGNWSWTPQPLPPIEIITSRPAPERPVYGLYCWENEYLQNHAFIKDIGWKNFRLSGPITDEVMRQYIKDDAEVMFTLPCRKPFREKGETNGRWRNRNNFDSDEAFIADFLNDVEAVLKRYGPGGSFFKNNPDLPERPLMYLEIFNEPNFWYLDVAREDLDHHFPPKDAAAREVQNLSRQKLYAKMLVAAYRKIKEVSPSVQAVGFAAGGAAGADVPFIKGVFAADPQVKDSFDILSTHPYIRPAPPDGNSINSWGELSIAGSTKTIRGVMKANGAETRPVWWTENNWSIYPEEGGAFVEGRIYKRDIKKDVSSELQAAYLVRGYAWALRLGVGRLHYMAITDTDGCNAGMINKDGSYRLSAHAVKNMIALMPRPKLLGAISENIDGTYIYRFDPDFSSDGDRAVIMAWRVQGPKTVAIPWSGESAVIIDMLGHAKTVAATGGEIQLEIGPYPVFFNQP